MIPISIMDCRWWRKGVDIHQLFKQTSQAGAATEGSHRQQLSRPVRYLDGDVRHGRCAAHGDGRESEEGQFGDSLREFIIREKQVLPVGGQHGLQRQQGNARSHSGGKLRSDQTRDIESHRDPPDAHRLLHRQTARLFTSANLQGNRKSHR